MIFSKIKAKNENYKDYLKRISHINLKRILNADYKDIASNYYLSNISRLEEVYDKDF
jgi:hypothetical protein